MNKELLNKVVELKKHYADEGFLIEGVFGSYIRNENTEFSDIDILYELSDQFRSSYKGFKAISKLDSIQQDISHALNIQADLVQKSSLGEVGRKYILPDVYYV